jgi:predicted DNA binding CopG/RHH family protein
MEQSMSDCARGTVHDAAIRFRVAEKLLASAEEKARREGMSLSELLRHALRRELREAA